MNSVKKALHTVVTKMRFVVESRHPKRQHEIPIECISMRGVSMNVTIKAYMRLDD